MEHREDILRQAEAAGASEAAKQWAETEELDRYFNVEALRKEQITSQVDNYRTHAETYVHQIRERFPDALGRANELWQEVETAFQDEKSSTTDSESQRCLKVVLMNDAKLGLLLRELEKQPEE